MKKISLLLLKVFGVGITLSLFAGGLSLLGYCTALFIGGDIATNLCNFIFKTYLPWVIKFTSLFTGIGLIGMYFSKQKALTVASCDIKKETNDYF